MKNLLQWHFLLIMILLFNSCTTDFSDTEDNIYMSTSITDSSIQKIGDSPGNIANEYDNAGVLHNQILESYLETLPFVTSVTGTLQDLNLIASSNPLFISLKPSNYSQPNAGRIEYIVNNESTNRAALIESLSISAKAKSSINSFINAMIVYQDQQSDYGIIYTYIVNFETSVINDAGYNADDLKILLTTASITRHAFYFERKRKRPRDRDWDISWGSIFAGGEGAEENSAKAVIMSAAAGVTSANKI